ncbi:MAG: LysM domain-containing protein [Phycisphaeraceae bacterium]
MKRMARVLASMMLCVAVAACSSTPEASGERTGEVTHTVAAGDTLGTLARQYYGDESKWMLIAQANPLVDPMRLRAEMELVIPPDPELDAAEPHAGAN